MGNEPINDIALLSSDLKKMTKNLNKPISAKTSKE